MIRSAEYYTRLLNTKPEVSKVMGIFNFPNGRPYQFIVAALTASAMVNSMFGNFFIFPLLGFILSADYFFKFKLRDDILDRCLVDEAMMEYNAKEEGESLEEEDRETIFDYVYSMRDNRMNLWQNIKFHYKELLKIATLEIFIYFLFERC